MHALLLLLAASSSFAQPEEADTRELRRQAVAGWAVRDVAENDGGRLIILERSGPGVSIRLRTNHWRGNGGVFRGAEVRIGDCASGDREALVDPDDKESAAELSATLRTYLDECDVTPRRQNQLLRGLEAAHCLFARWTAEAQADTDFENAQIVAHGTGETPQRPAPAYPACHPPRST